MRRPWQVWLLFAVALAIVLAATGWLSLAALGLDRARTEAHHRAQLEETVRLALWRTDSALSPLIAEERVRPYFAYSSFHPAERAYTRMFAPIRTGDVLLPSEILTTPSPYVVVHFQIGPDGRFTSPQVPEGNMRDLAEVAAYVLADDIDAAGERLADLADRVGRGDMIAELPTARLRAEMAVQSPAGDLLDSAQPLHEGAQWSAQQARQQEQQNTAEYEARHQRLVDAVPQPEGKTSSLSTDVRTGAMRPFWIGNLLLLVRRVNVSGVEYIQGCQLDWPALSRWLTEGTADLLPAGRLVPVTCEEEMDRSRMLAALPVRLAPGAVPPSPTGGMRSVHIMLVATWVSVLLAATAVAVLLRGAVALSERRGAFVSAVTHELRTPLTTFRMYTEMLAEGMVEQDQRLHYLHTLKREAERLGHLVGNVLAYARLERTAGPKSVAPFAIGHLLDRAGQRLGERARQAGMTLAVEADETVRGAMVHADASAVEQILFNLVDNACKYAAGAEDRRVHVTVERAYRQARFLVRDHGPGIARGEESRIFRPFRKSARQAAETAPGVGLGLALSRRLARDMGGGLELSDAAGEGAAFLLTLPLGA